MKSIIWDFNGTILDDAEAGLKSANRLLINHGKKPLSGIDEYREIFGFPITEYYIRLGFDFAKEPFVPLAHEWTDYYNEFSVDCGLCNGVEAVIKEFARQGRRQVVLSAAEKGYLCKSLSKFCLLDCFEAVLGLDNIYAESKLELAESWFLHGGDKNSVLIGDTLHDFEVASKLGVECVLVCGGHQSRSRLAKSGATVLDGASQLIYEKSIAGGLTFSK